MNQITIRAAQPADSTALTTINAAGQPGVAPLTPDELVGIATGAIRCWVAVAAASDEVAGYLIAYTSADAYDGEEFAWFGRTTRDFLYVDQIAIAPERRRGGVGAALYRAASAFARAQGLAALTCEVNLEPPNPTSLRFHHAQGFAQIGTLATQDGRTVALLRVPLTLAP